MPEISVRIPQIGEGLQEARLVGVLKQPGEKVKRDEPIYQMETDKAVMDVESPYDGVIVKWLAEPDEILQIGAEVAVMSVEGDAQEMVVHGAPAAASSETESAKGGKANIPPRTRAYAKEKGMSDEQLERLASGGAKLMPADIDAFLSGGSPSGNDAYTESPMPQKQRLLASRLVRGSQLVVPGTISVPVNWAAIENVRARVKASRDEFQPSSFTMFAYGVAVALRDFPMFRTTMVGDDKLRTYKHAQLGIAVALPGDELVLAVVPDADSLGWREFAEKARAQITLAREGKDQASESMTISLTNMQSYGLRDAVAVVVPPAVGTLFLGATYLGFDPELSEPKPVRLANISLTFDHRVINGVGAAQFLAAIKKNVESISSLIGG